MPTRDNQTASAHDTPLAREERLRLGYSRVALILTVLLLGSTFLLISPPREMTYPGAIPWSDFSILRPLTELLSFNGLLTTARGIEIKDFALHLAAVIGLIILAARSASVGTRLSLRRRLYEPWLAAQFLLLGWVALAALSRRWSGDPDLVYGQAALYALSLAWAISLAWTLERRHMPHLLATLVLTTTLAAILCIWYYGERNPDHRPGFPLGNPGILAASMLPAILITLCVLLGTAQRWLRDRRRPDLAITSGAVLAFVLLIWCFTLTNSRAAIVALAVGLAAVAFLVLGARARWVIAIVVLCGLSSSGAWLLSQSQLDTAMARSATIRFRVYAWRYAAELWEHNWFTAIAGHGAGAYPRLAGQLSLHDRELDPSAFMGEMVEHAHNELFEVLSEIGLVGGVTFVGGFLGTLIAGGILLRGKTTDHERWLYIALLAGVVALMTDALFSPNLRLAGIPALFYTLIGVLWATCRAAATEHLSGHGSAPQNTYIETTSRRRPGIALIVLLLATGVGWLTIRNWVGVLREEAAQYAFAQGDYEQARRDHQFAQAHLLDPVRQLINNDRVVRAHLALARQATVEFLDRQNSAAVLPASQTATTTVSPELNELQEQASSQCIAAFEAAAQLGRRAPTLMGTAASGASAAELLALLYQASNPALAQQWYHTAGRAWYLQRKWRPYDIATLLALTQHPAPLPNQLGLLRDALRSTHGYSRWGWPLSLDDIRINWHNSLRQLAVHELFAETLEQLLAVVGPADPDTNLDSLIASRAPEVYRLAGYYHALQGDYTDAQRMAARAAELYQPMQARFPILHSVALLEEAEFILRGSPEQAQRAEKLLREALKLLPRIQQQKYEALAWPFRNRLALALLAQGSEDEASQIFLIALGDETLVPRALADTCVRLALLDIRQLPGRLPSDRRAPVETWLKLALRRQPDHVPAWSWLAWLAAERADLERLHTILADATTAGVQTADIQRIQNSLRQEFPTLFE